MMTARFAGSGTVFRFLLRQYWKRVLIWVLGFIVVSAGAGMAYADIYADAAAIRGYALTMENPVMHALIGPGYAVEDYHLGALFANQLLLFSAIAAAIMNISLTLKSTRTDEEEGRLEVLLSLPVGRSAITWPTLLLLLVANGLLAVALGAALSLVHLENMPPSACFYYSALLGGEGLFFAGAALLGAQLAQTSRGAAQLAYGILLISYFLRAVGDMQENGLSLFSPLGWLGEASVFVANRLWPLAALLIGFLTLAVAALYANHRRDLGAGLLPVRKGRAGAFWGLRSPLALFWQMERMQVGIWAAGLSLLGMAFAAILGDLENYFSQLEIVQTILPQDAQVSFTQEMVSLVLTILAMFAGIPVINVVLRLRREEESGRIEHLLTLPISRTSLFGSTITLAAFVAVIMQSVLAASFYFVTQGMGMERFQPEELWLASYAFLPALLFLGSLALLLISFRPSLSYIVWVYLLFSFLITYLGGLLDFPEWLKRGSAFYAVPHMPFGEADWGGPLAYAGLTVAALLGGWARYRRRDIPF